MAEKSNFIPFPSQKTSSINIPLNKGIGKANDINSKKFSDCENITSANLPVISPSDMRVSMHSQLNYFNITSPSTVFDGDGGSRLISMGDYLLLIRWGMCGQNINDAYCYVKDGKNILRDFKKGYHYVICDCLVRTRINLSLKSSAVIYDEFEDLVLNANGEVFANPNHIIDTDIHPDEMDEADTSCIYLHNGVYYYFDELWTRMKTGYVYVYNKDKYYYDEYLSCWIKMKGYSDAMRDACIFSEWKNGTGSMLFGKYKKYIVIMPDAVAIELDDKGYPCVGQYCVEGEMINASIRRAYDLYVDSMVIHRLDCYIDDGMGNVHNTVYPEIDAITSGATRLFGTGNGRIYATKANTMDNFSYDSAEYVSSDNAWAVSVSNEGTASSRLGAICNFNDELIAFSDTYAYKIYGKANPFRIGVLFDKGTFSKKSIAECDGKLYFVNSEGIFSYNGVTVNRIDNDLSLGRITSAVVTSADRIVYAYIECDVGKFIYTYDTLYKVWHRMSLPYDSYIESDERILKDVYDMVSMKGKVYILTYASEDFKAGGLETVNYDMSKVQIYSLSEGSVSYGGYNEKWFLESGMINASIPDLQRVSSVEILVKGDKNSRLKVYLMNDCEEKTDKNLLCDYVLSGDTEVIRYRVRKSEALFHRLRIEGEGDASIYSISMKVRCGGEKYESD